ncbi:DUF7859 family protein [Halanaeroarchaeum sulfurireducens]|nr:hypothetical protein [Halanaeroarchaeum sulfurireducens]
MIGFDFAYFFLLAALLLFFFFIFLMIRRTLVGFREGVDRQKD